MRYKEFLHYRLLRPFEHPRGRPQVVCPCHRAVDLVQDPTHESSCHLNGGIRTDRHDQVRDILHKTLLRALPNATIRLEPEQEDQDHRRRPDIHVLNDGVEYAIDVAIVDPCSLVYTRHPTASSVSNPAGAAILHEAHKTRLYRDTVHAPHLIPFVLETTGRLGPSARAFLDRVTATATFARSTFLTEVSFILARAIGKSILQTRRRVARL